MELRYKSIVTLALTLCLSGLLGACSEEDKVFDESPAERTSLVMKEALKVLQAQTNGWEMIIFPSDDQWYGGYTSFVLFGSDGVATTATELQADPSTRTRGLYSVDNSNGPTLNFDTYNKGIHAYSEPASEYFTESQNLGADGDYSFTIVSYSAEEVVLRGVRSGAYARLRPLASSDWTPLLRAYKNSSQNNYLPTAKLTIDGETIAGAKMTKKRHLEFEYKGTSYELPFRYTDSGIQLYEPTQIGSTRVQTFRNEGTSRLPVLTDESGAVKISFEADYASLLVNEVWMYSTVNASGRFARAITEYNTYLNTGFGGRINTARIFFGLIGGELIVYASQIYISATAPVYAGQVNFTHERISNNEIKISYDEDASKAGDGGFNGLMMQHRNVQMIGAGFSNIGQVETFNDPDKNGRTFTITAEEGTARPSWIRLQDKSDPQNYIRLMLLN